MAPDMFSSGQERKGNPGCLVSVLKDPCHPVGLFGKVKQKFPCLSSEQPK